MSKAETIRRLRLGDLQKILRSHYGYNLPDDDAGREDLVELLLPISLGPEDRRKMANAIEIYAPWMGADEAGQLIDQINRMPLSERKVSARRLGERLRVSNQEREALKLKTIKPFDKTDRELKDLRRAKDRVRDRARRRQRGQNLRQTYLANSLAKLKPWKSEGVSRAT